MTASEDTAAPALRAVMRAAEAGRALADPQLADAGLLRVVEGGHAAILQAAPAPRRGFLARRAGLARSLVARQVLIERLLDAGDVLAVRGEPRLGAGAARAMLAAGAGEISDALAGFAGRVQYQIAVSADPSAAPPREVVPALLARILSVVEDAVELPRGEPADLANLGVLVARAGLARLEAALEAIDAESAVPLTIRLIGPNAPVSFAALELERPGPRTLARARQSLGLEPQDCRSDPARAFRAVAFAGAGEAAQRRDMDALCRARDLLLRDRAARARLAAAGFEDMVAPPLLRICRDVAASPPARRSAA